MHPDSTEDQDDELYLGMLNMMVWQIHKLCIHSLALSGLLLGKGEAEQ